MRSPFDPASSSAASLMEPADQDLVQPEVDEEALERATAEKREHLRFDKMFSVRVESLLFGEMYCVARNVSAGGIFLELRDPLPLGATVRVCFPVPDGSGDVVAT
ncbi:MAG TPA: PilZ domain-containing protein, partial [Polyangia bacterium]|nr:PilZ domain-containing protein [Polyangia bacterium]